MGNNLDSQYILEVGTKIRSVRKGLSKTLEEVAQEIGVTRSFLSQVERGKVAPSITSLRKIAKTLRIPIFLLLNSELENDQKTNVVVRKSERRNLILPHATTIYQLLSPDLNRKIEMILTHLDPDSSSCDEPLFHNGEECAFVLAGKVLIEVGGEEYILEEGDSFYFDCGIPHKITNIGDTKVEIVSAITPPNF
ncbi:MAG: cupin domain-containing protein [Candidatus Electryonea clarkiae]|nr:cupin domain-containing protein [Candidatus Electryonea clarkiae]